MSHQMNIMMRKTLLLILLITPALFNVKAWNDLRIIDLGGYPAEEQIRVTWDGKDGSGEEIEQGIYLVRYLSKFATKTLRVVKVQ